MTMTRKDLELVAESLQQERPESNLFEYAQWLKMVTSLSFTLNWESEYQGFDRHRFLVACGAR